MDCLFNFSKCILVLVLVLQAVWCTFFCLPKEKDGVSIFFKMKAYVLSLLFQSDQFGSMFGTHTCQEYFHEGFDMGEVHHICFWE